MQESESQKYKTLPKVLAFDLDGTIAKSKNPIEKDMVDVFCKLMQFVPMSIVSGASKEQFENQFLAHFPKDFDFTDKLYIFPQNGAELIEYRDGKWLVKYQNKFEDKNKQEIISSLNLIVSKFDLKENPEHGPLIEDRGEQVTLSALGQRAPLELKAAWDPDQNIRKQMKPMLDALLPDNEIRIGGTTSIDITKKGVNKAYAMRCLLEILNLESKDLLYFGDALYPGGNDEIVKANGFPCYFVHNPEETLKALRDILEVYEKTNRK